MFEHENILELAPDTIFSGEKIFLHAVLPVQLLTVMLRRIQAKLTFHYVKTARLDIAIQSNDE